MESERHDEKKTNKTRLFNTKFEEKQCVKRDTLFNIGHFW